MKAIKPNKVEVNVSKYSDSYFLSFHISALIAFGVNFSRNSGSSSSALTAAKLFLSNQQNSLITKA